MSEKEAPVGEVVELESGIEPFVKRRQSQR